MKKLLMCLRFFISKPKTKSEIITFFPFKKEMAIIKLSRAEPIDFIGLMSIK